MTSEVLILNKRGAVLAADSAVTTSGGDQGHPRYSKSANKIFELTQNGSIAAAIYGNAQIDSVPWELAIKLFRKQFGDSSHQQVKQYADSLMAYLSGNDRLFPEPLRLQWIESQFDKALQTLVADAQRSNPSIFDESVPLDERRAHWAVEQARLESLLDGMDMPSSLSQPPLDQLLSHIGSWATRAKEQIDQVSTLAAVDPVSLAQLGHKLRYKMPDWILSGTGLVIVGYGEEAIFPASRQLEVFGHVGDEIYVKTVRDFEVTHLGPALIQPLAQTSMIDMFTDGFGQSLELIIRAESRSAFANLFSALSDAGVSVPPELVESITDSCQLDFMNKWKLENWRKNFHPLIEVLQSLSVQEIGHLAESLLGLESLKERVTSPSESVGGPIDVAVITKSEGLVWIKRKHYFDPALNIRYAARLDRSLKEDN